MQHKLFLISRGKQRCNRQTKQKPPQPPHHLTALQTGACRPSEHSATAEGWAMGMVSNPASNWRLRELQRSAAHLCRRCARAAASGGAAGSPPAVRSRGVSLMGGAIGKGVATRRVQDEAGAQQTPRADHQACPEARLQ